MATDLEKMFKELIESETKKFETERDSSFFDDPDQIKFSPGKTYEFRLIFYLSKKSKRTKPFINQCKHVYWDSENKERYEEICPVSEYILGKQGFKVCNVCGYANKRYKEFSEDGIKASEALYKRFKRVFNGYALVYVVNDPSNEENNGTIKIMRYGIDIMKWLKREIYGIDIANKTIKEKIIGADAFTDGKKVSGYNLIVSVSSKKDGDRTYNQYDLSFDRDKTDIKITVKEIEAAVEQMEFDKKYYKPYSKQKLLEFEKSCILKENSPSEADETDVPEEFRETKSKVSSTKETKDKTSTSADDIANELGSELDEEFNESKSEEMSEENLFNGDDIDLDGDIDIDDLLK